MNLLKGMTNFSKLINWLAFIGSSASVFVGSYFFIIGERRIARILFIVAIAIYIPSLFFTAFKKTIRFNKVIKIKTFIGSLMSVVIGIYFFIIGEYRLASFFFIITIVQYLQFSFFRNREKIKEVKNNENEELEKCYDTKGK